VTQLTQVGVGIPSRGDTVNRAIEGPFIRYAPERSLFGTPPGITLPRIRLASNKEIENMVTEKGKTHK